MRGIGRLRAMRRTVELRWRTMRDAAPVRAVKWIKSMQAPSGGLRPTPDATSTTPEVTGYTIPTLIDFGERDFAKELALWEVSVQRGDGGFELEGIPHTFDTAQVARGYLALLDEMPELEQHLRSACDYVSSHITEDGEVSHESYEVWRLPDGTLLSEYGNLYVLPPLVEAAERLDEPRWAEAAERAMERFRSKPDLVEFKPELATLSHYFGYMMDALVDLGETSLATEGLEQVVEIQREDGAIPAFPGAPWVCSTGIAQLCIAMYKLGWWEPADRAMDWLEAAQNPGGGFYGSYGPGGEYFPRREILWAAKFYLDALMHRIEATFDREAYQYEEQIDPADGRARAILEAISDLESPRILDVGCGKGRYLRVIAENYPDAELYGVDISGEMLAACPPEAQVGKGSVLNTGHASDSFDCVICVEALEHALLPENAVKELVRVVRPGGSLVIIDKSAKKLGIMPIMAWEQWFDPQGLTDILRDSGIDAAHRSIEYGEAGLDDGLFAVWQGVKVDG